jgi:hypothetical protein
MWPRPNKEMAQAFGKGRVMFAISAIVVGLVYFLMNSLLFVGILKSSLHLAIVAFFVGVVINLILGIALVLLGGASPQGRYGYIVRSILGIKLVWLFAAIVVALIIDQESFSKAPYQIASFVIFGGLLIWSRFLSHSRD